MDEYTVDDFKNSIILKNQLITLNIDKLTELYKDEDNYINFINTLITIINNDTTFLMFKTDIINKIYHIISLNRFNLEKENQNIINDIVSNLNSIKSFPTPQNIILKNGYISYQEDLRKIRFKNEDDFFDHLAFNALVVVGIENNNLDFIEDNNMFISSLNFLLETIPEIFQEESTRCLINEYLNNIKTNKLDILTLKKQKINNLRKRIVKIQEKEY